MAPVGVHHSPVQPARRRHLTTPPMAHERFHECIEVCQDCAVLGAHCASLCLRDAGVAALVRCIELNQSCAALCSLAVAEMARDSEHVARVCGLCAEVCDACAHECGRHPHDHCQACAEVCRRCAEECRNLAGTAVGVGGGDAQ